VLGYAIPCEAAEAPEIRTIYIGEVTSLPDSMPNIRVVHVPTVHWGSNSRD